MCPGAIDSNRIRVHAKQNSGSMADLLVDILENTVLLRLLVGQDLGPCSVVALLEHERPGRVAYRRVVVRPVRLPLRRTDRLGRRHAAGLAGARRQRRVVAQLRPGALGEPVVELRAPRAVAEAAPLRPQGLWVVDGHGGAPGGRPRAVPLADRLRRQPLLLRVRPHGGAPPRGASGTGPLPVGESLREPGVQLDVGWLWLA
mmetsp:Transcript_30873/g.81045  ORF Transcript_30873/g.81045 Transcript_30873/m.81045 type:complete len:202 (+) Transcript_30873:67-672(+)